MSEPRARVYLTLPREWLCQPLEFTQRFSGSLAPATKTQADQASLEKSADLLIGPESPLLVTKYLGRNPEAVAHLVELAELLSIPVAQQLNHLNFPTDHPLYVGTQTVKAGSNAAFL